MQNTKRQKKRNWRLQWKQMFLRLVSLMGLVIIGHGLPQRHEVGHGDYHAFLNEHEKPQATSQQEFLQRFEIFKRNHQLIHNHNYNRREPNDVRLQMNHFGDLFDHEINTHLSFLQIPHHHSSKLSDTKKQRFLKHLEKSNRRSIITHAGTKHPDPFLRQHISAVDKPFVDYVENTEKYLSYASADAITNDKRWSHMGSGDQIAPENDTRYFELPPLTLDIPLHATPPQSVDWRTKGIVGRVMNQVSD